MEKKEKFIELTPEESKDKIISYIKSKDKKTRIIGLFAKAKKVVFENNIQVSRFYSRHLRDAIELDCYSDDRIIKTIKYLLDNADYKWSLRTVIKHIDENFDELDGRTPIITLKNGEKIYSVERVKQLERDGRIYYQSNSWKENG